jgi:hypothetical protein
MDVPGERILWEERPSGYPPPSLGVAGLYVLWVIVAALLWREARVLGLLGLLEDDARVLRSIGPLFLPLSLLALELWRVSRVRGRCFQITESSVLIKDRGHTLQLGLLSRIGKAVVARRALEMTTDRGVVRFAPIEDPKTALSALEAARAAEPRPPWVIYAGHDPTWSGWRQGTSEYWFAWTWRPFWAALDADARRVYLERWSAPPAWREALER